MKAIVAVAAASVSFDSSSIYRSLTASGGPTFKMLKTARWRGAVILASTKLQREAKVAAL